jgi:hypothetical protein
MHKLMRQQLLPFASIRPEVAFGEDNMATHRIGIGSNTPRRLTGSVIRVDSDACKVLPKA